MTRLHWLFPLLALVAVACGGGDDDDDDLTDDDVSDDDAWGDDDDDSGPSCDFAVHDPLIADGKAALGESRVADGYADFAAALAQCPESVDARMGLALACQLELERKMYAMIEYVVSVAPNFGWKDKSMGSVLQAVLLTDLYPKALEMAGHARAVQAAPPGWSFYQAPYPFIVDGEFTDRVWVDMSGEWDASDARMIEAEAEFYAGLILSIGSYDLTLDWYWTQHMPDLDGLDLLGKLHALTGWALAVVEDPNYPMFLLVRGDLGKGFLHDAGLAWGAAGTGFADAVDRMRAETDDQRDDVAGYVDENGDGTWNEGEVFHLPLIGVLTPDQDLVWQGLVALALSFGESAWDTGPSDVDPENPNELLLSDLNFLLTAFGLEPILPPFGKSLGPHFYDPRPEQLKEAARGLLRFLYGASAPVEGEGR
jgi:hypothetical protein